MAKTFIDALTSAATPSNCSTSFQHAGLFPFNMSKILSNQYVTDFPYQPPSGNHLDLSGVILTDDETIKELDSRSTYGRFIPPPANRPLIPDDYDGDQALVQNFKIGNKQGELFTSLPPATYLGSSSKGVIG